MAASSEQTLTSFKIPLSIVLTWPKPNVVTPAKRTWLVPMSICLEVVTGLVVIARVFLRVSHRAGPPGLDDLLIVFGWVFGLCFTVAIIWAVLYGGFDRHVWDLLPLGSVAESGGFASWLSQIAFLLSTGFTKLSILFCHRRIIHRSINPALKWAIRSAVTFTIVLTLAFIISLCLTCSPTSAQWTTLNIANADKPFKCISPRLPDILVGCFGVVSDVYALFLPILYVRNLSVTTRQKFALWSVFGCGIIVVGMGIARTYYLGRLTDDPRRDLTYVGYNAFVWSELEAHLAIICASAPALRVFFRKYLVQPMMKFSSARSATNTRNTDEEELTSMSTTRNTGLGREISMESWPSGQQGEPKLSIEKSTTVVVKYDNAAPQAGLKNMT